MAALRPCALGGSHAGVCRLHGRNDIRVESAEIGNPGPGEVRVAMAAGGICGSDLHYFHDGGFGPIRVREPIILGHEASATVVALGAGVAGLSVGDRVAINPSRPCGGCRYCREGLTTHCLEMRFNGSAMRLPHEQGLFREQMVVGASQCFVVGSDTSFEEAACAEPLAVCLHARSMAGPVEGRRVLVTGAGPIGALCAALAAEGGAADVVVTDLQDFPLDVARRMGATRVVNVAQDAAALDVYAADKGWFDIVFECSAAAPAICAAIAATRPQGRLVQVGVAGDTPLPLNGLVGEELTYQGSQRFLPADFAEAVRLISARRIDVRPIVTGRYPLAEAEAAFRAAGDRTAAVKVQLVFGAG